MSWSSAFAPMLEQDLDWVVSAESRLHCMPWSRENFIDSLAAGYGCWTMRTDGASAGYAIVLSVLDEAHLLNISVVRERQGRGLGRSFLEHLLERARCDGASCFFLEVRLSNLPARALYQKVGFIEIGRRKGYYPSTEGREDAIVMRAAL